MEAIEVQPDGKILIAGSFTEVAGVPRRAIARLNANGNLDEGFHPCPGADAWAGCLALQPDGKVLVGGQFTRMNGAARVHLARLHPDGSLDLTFNPSVTLLHVNSLAVQSEGRILVAHLDGVVRLNSDGSPDDSFAPGVLADDEWPGKGPIIGYLF